MPRIRKSPAQEEDAPVVAVSLPEPTEPIEIELEAEDVGSTMVELAPAVEPKPEPVVEDDPVKKALEAQQRADHLQRSLADMQRQRDEASRQGRARETELIRERDDGHYNTVLVAIGAETSTADKAQLDYENAMAAGDWKTAAAAQRIMSAATAKLTQLEDTKVALETRNTQQPVIEPRRAPAPAPAQDVESRITALVVPDSAKSWLRKHPDFINDNAKNSRLGNFHRTLVDDGVEQFSPAYFDALDTKFGFKTAPAAQPVPQPRKSMPMSAPVSREAPTSSGQPLASTKMHLTAEQRDIARKSRPDLPADQAEKLYAQNVRKLNTMRANGSYRATTEQNG